MAESKAFGTIKLCTSSHKSYILRYDPASRQFTLVIHVSNSPDHEAIVKQLWDICLLHGKTIDSSGTSVWLSKEHLREVWDSLAGTSDETLQAGPRNINTNTTEKQPYKFQVTESKFVYQIL